MSNGREDKNPWSKWYWQDWESDTGLRASSLASQGLWMRMLSIMARSKKKGFLLDGESKMESKTLAKLVGEQVPVIDALLAELYSHSVYGQTDDGIIFNRRMARESELSEIRAEAGRLGGRPKSKPKAKEESKSKAASASASSYGSSSLELEAKEIHPDDLRLVQILIDLMQRNNPSSTTLKNLTPARQAAWIRECRLLREKDGKSAEDIEAVIRYSQNDKFWQSNILSMGTLREKWDRLWLKARGSDPHAGIKEWLAEKEREDAGKE
jgi:hypothetical protein